VKRYPDLAAVPEDERADCLYTKIVADGVNGVFVGTWCSVFIIVFCTILFSSSQTLAVGFLFRRSGRLLPILLPYSEITFTATGVALALLSVFEHPTELLSGRPVLAWSLPAASSFTGLVIIGVLYWRPLFRLTFYAAILVSWSTWQLDLRFPWYFPVALWLGVLFLLARYYIQRPRAKDLLPDGSGG
jgi:hypothetical protein